jgi:YggT family protein
LLLYFLVMWVRLILDFARNFARNWRPRGAGLILAEIVFAVTDPPIKLVRRAIPPIRMGAIAIDFAWSIVMLVVVILLYVAVVLR